ncbi:MAG: hypothetical protein ACTSPV_17860 [Candidatus Hodarchaeales archaeon]
MDLESIKKTQRELSEMIGVSGYEDRVLEYIISRIEDKVDKLWVDRLGSLLAIKKGSLEKERIMLDAHIDEVGFMISYIERGGFLRFVPIGGWDTRILLGQAVKIVGNDGKIYDGITGSKPPHLTTEAERKSAVEIKDLYIATRSVMSLA